VSLPIILIHPIIVYTVFPHIATVMQQHGASVAGITAAGFASVAVITAALAAVFWLLVDLPTQVLIYAILKSSES
ncbi:hypothetical protein HK405_002837, partial [Cladochytrium tenue]